MFWNNIIENRAKIFLYCYNARQPVGILQLMRFINRINAYAFAYGFQLSMNIGLDHLQINKNALAILSP